MANEKKNTSTDEQLISKSLRRNVAFRMSFLQGSWNFERLQNMGFAFAIAPVLKKLYTSKEDRAEALKRHMEFFNTHPYVAAPVMGVTMAMEEAKAQGKPVDASAIGGVKVGMMGPLAGVGDPIFWGTIRPVLGAFVATSFAATGSILAPIIFFLVWNIMRLAFLWYTQELGYRRGSEIAQDLGSLQKLTYGSSILGMFVMGVLVPRWTTMKFPAVISTAQTSSDVTNNFVKAITEPLQVLGTSSASVQDKGSALTTISTQLKTFPGFTTSTTVQSIFDQILPGLGPLLLLFFTLFLLGKKIKPIWILLGYFVLGIILYVIGILGK